MPHMCAGSSYVMYIQPATQVSSIIQTATATNNGVIMTVCQSAVACCACVLQAPDDGGPAGFSLTLLVGVVTKLKMQVVLLALKQLVLARKQRSQLAEWAGEFQSWMTSWISAHC